MTGLKWHRARKPRETEDARAGVRRPPKPRLKTVTKADLRQQANDAIDAFGPVRRVLAVMPVDHPRASEPSGYREIEHALNERKFFIDGEARLELARTFLAQYRGERLDVFTDGGCSPNPGKGGWGVAVIAGGKVVAELYGGAAQTTNNRMELTAALVALRVVPEGPVVVSTDSRYVMEGASKWAAGWERRGWRTREGAEVANQDLWRQIIAADKIVSPEWRWLRGHAGHLGNELADRLALKGRDSDGPGGLAKDAT